MRGCRKDGRNLQIHLNTLPNPLMTATQGADPMRYFALVLAVVGAATAARAQDAIPDLKGTWSGKGKVIIFGGHAHHPDVRPDSPPTVRDIEMTLLVEGQD